MGTDGLMYLYSFAYIAGLIVSIFALVYFFQMCNNIRKIREMMEAERGLEVEAESESGTKGNALTIFLIILVVVLATVVFVFSHTN